MFSYDVILCTYEGDKYITSQLETILLQTIKPSKIIISDDSSSEKTIRKAELIFNSFAYKDYIFINGPRSGVVFNFLSALKYSESDFLFLSDQDDVWELDKVDTLFNLITSDLKNVPLLLFSDASLIDEQGNKLHHSFIKKQRLNLNILNDDSIQFENCIQGAACCVNSSLREILVKAVENIDLRLVVMHDWFIAIIAKYSGNICFCDKALLGYRVHQENQVGYISFSKKLLKFFSLLWS
ncbi:glycosyltransferase [Vibrio cholerae]